MNKRLQDVINGNESNYILPFFWQHGSDEATLREYIEKIQGCGIHAVCIESRPHPDFLGDLWWENLDVIIDEARKRDMQVWILDDSHFPTGFANGAVEKADDKLKRWSLVEKHYTLQGPKLHIRLEVSNFLGQPKFTMGPPRGDKKFHPEYLVSVVVAKVLETSKGEVLTCAEDVTDYVKDGFLCYDFREDVTYRVMVYTCSQDAASTCNNYISFLEKDSVKILLDTVYEPHFAHYKDLFGTTIAGFFSDEPGFYNLAGMAFNPEAAKIGYPQMPLPWTDGVMQRMSEKFGADTSVWMPGLFYMTEGEKDSEVRLAYMDIITKMYQENFSEQLGDWCRAHQVEYIGHVLEDVSLNTSLGPGTGHFFRAMAGQDRSGIDVVLNYLLPDEDREQGSFYHYGLATLGASAAHQNSRTKGRAMCEIFGAFGWVEGLSMMKWMTDLMLVNGINCYVPHAFSEAPFPDPDCPPHFYAHGMNPQYPYMHYVFDYMNKMCHLLNGGHADVKTAVFFPAEPDWVGKTMRFETIGKELLTNQIPYEILCMDALDEAVIKNGQIVIGNAAYECLFVGGCDKLPDNCLEKFQAVKNAGIPVYFVDQTPKTLTGETIRQDIPQISLKETFEKADKFRPITLSKPEKWLRVYRYIHENLTIYMLANTSMYTEVDTNITFLKDIPNALYHAMEGIMEKPVRNADGSYHLKLAKSESVLFLAGDISEVTLESFTKEKITHSKEVIYERPFELSLAEYNDVNAYNKKESLSKLCDIALLYPRHSGKISYEFQVSNENFDRMDFGECYEALDLYINDVYVSTRICAPYSFDIKNYMKEGSNQIKAVVTTHLGNAMMDPLSCMVPNPATGILGPIKLFGGK